ncbi:unnamed protein product, partial [Medioppia subpectinata]
MKSVKGMHCFWPKCQFKTNKQRYLKTHLLIHSEKRFNCDFNNCHKSYKHRSELSKHKNIVHLNRGKEMHCFWPKCQYKTRESKKFTAHQSMHLNVKQFKCDFNNCNKSFTQFSNLQTHKNPVHLNVKFICDFNECHKSFTSKKGLFLHKSCVHLNERKFKCNEENCGKKFTSTQSLIQHKRIHSGEKPFVCDFIGCNKSFRKRSNLMDHKIIHSNDATIYSCFWPKCQYKTKNKWSFRTHELIHSELILTHENHLNIKSYKCIHNNCNQRKRRPVPDLLYLSQIHEAMAIRSQVELYRRNREVDPQTGFDGTMGALYWHNSTTYGRRPTYYSLIYQF